MWVIFLIVVAIVIAIVAALVLTYEGINEDGNYIFYERGW